MRIRTVPYMPRPPIPATNCRFGLPEPRPARITPAADGTLLQRIFPIFPRSAPAENTSSQQPPLRVIPPTSPANTDEEFTSRWRFHRETPTTQSQRDQMRTTAHDCDHPPPRSFWRRVQPPRDAAAIPDEREPLREPGVIRGRHHNPTRSNSSETAKPTTSGYEGVNPTDCPIGLSVTMTRPFHRASLCVPVSSLTPRCEDRLRLRNISPRACPTPA